MAPAQRGEQGGFDVVAVGGFKVLEIRREQGVAGGALDNLFRRRCGLLEA